MNKLLRIGITLGLVIAVSGIGFKLMHFPGSVEMLVFGLALSVICFVVRLFTGKKVS